MVLYTFTSVSLNVAAKLEFFTEKTPDGLMEMTALAGGAKKNPCRNRGRNQN